jgi:hypothetical protein
MHVACRVILDFPVYETKLPTYLLQAGVKLHEYKGGTSPSYGDPQILEALQQFIYSFGKRYDGDKRVGFVQAGLLGFWGQLHTWGYDFLPYETCQKGVGWYAAAFSKTQVQLRYREDSAISTNTRTHPTGRVRFSYDRALNYQTETVPPYMTARTGPET